MKKRFTFEYELSFTFYLLSTHLLSTQVRVIPIQLQKLFARLLLVQQQSIGTQELTDSFGWTNNEVGYVLVCVTDHAIMGTSRLRGEHGQVVKVLDWLVRCWEFKPHKNHLNQLSLCALDQGTSLYLFHALEGTLSCQSCVHVFLTHSVHVKEYHRLFEKEQGIILICWLCVKVEEFKGGNRVSFWPLC